MDPCRSAVPAFSLFIDAIFLITRQTSNWWSKKIKINTINRLLGFLVLSFLALVCIANSVKAQAAPAAQPPEVTALIDRAVIENLMVDYYSHIGNSSFNFGQYFVKDGVLGVNGIVAKERKKLRHSNARASGGAAAAPPSRIRMHHRQACSICS